MGCALLRRNPTVLRPCFVTPAANAAMLGCPSQRSTTLRTASLPLAPALPAQARSDQIRSQLMQAAAAEGGQAMARGSKFMVEWLHVMGSSRLRSGAKTGVLRPGQPGARPPHSMTRPTLLAGMSRATRQLNR